MFVEDAPHDLSLSRFYLPVAAIAIGTGSNAIAVGAPAWNLALADAT
jgi:hypothetical protein